MEASPTFTKHPSDHQMLDLLRRRLQDARIAPWIHDADVYGGDPVAITARYAPATAANGSPAWYFVCTPQTKQPKDPRITRMAGKGTWKEERGEPLLSATGGIHQEVGYKRTFSYVIKALGKKSTPTRLGWIMLEVKLPGINPCLCKIYRTPRTCKNQLAIALNISLALPDAPGSAPPASSSSEAGVDALAAAAAAAASGFSSAAAAAASGCSSAAAAAAASGFSSAAAAQAPAPGFSSAAAAAAQAPPPGFSSAAAQAPAPGFSSAAAAAAQAPAPGFSSAAQAPAPGFSPAEAAAAQAPPPAFSSAAAAATQAPAPGFSSAAAAAAAQSPARGFSSAAAAAQSPARGFSSAPDAAQSRTSGFRLQDPDVAETSPPKRWVQVEISDSPTRASERSPAKPKRVYRMMLPQQEGLSPSAKKQRFMDCRGWLTIEPHRGSDSPIS